MQVLNVLLKNQLGEKYEERKSVKNKEFQDLLDSFTSVQ